MSEKIKMFRFGAADIMNELLVLPTMDSEKEEDMDITPFKEFITQNEKDLTLLGSYLEDVASAYKVDQIIPKPPKSIETKTNNLVTQLQQVIKQHYPAILVEPSVYRGMTVYYKSDGVAKFFQITKTAKEIPDYNDYFGHCMAFGKYLTKLICVALGYGLEIGRGVIKILLKIHKIPKEIRDWIDDILKRIFDKIKYELEKYKNHETGMIWFYFDRADTILHIHDKFDPKLQPEEKWLPSYFYPQADWIKVFP